MRRSTISRKELLLTFTPGSKSACPDRLSALATTLTNSRTTRRMIRNRGWTRPTIPVLRTASFGKAPQVYCGLYFHRLIHESLRSTRSCFHVFAWLLSSLERALRVITFFVRRSCGVCFVFDAGTESLLSTCLSTFSDLSSLDFVDFCFLPRNSKLLLSKATKI